METIQQAAGVFRKMTAFMLAFMCTVTGAGQQLYDDNEDSTWVRYHTRPDRRVEQYVKNPAPDSTNSSQRCARFARNRQRFDYIKAVPAGRLENVDAYASYEPVAAKLRMKVYTDAPAGSVVELQLGKQDGNAYPEGTHSQYQAVTTKSGAWEELEFRFVTVPKGSETSARQVNQVTILFRPNTADAYVFYFDDLRGPVISQPAAVRWFRKK